MPAIGRIKQVLLKAIGKSGQLGCDFCKTLACSSFQLDSAQSKITNRVAYGFLFGEIQPIQFPAFINALEPGKQVAIVYGDGGFGLTGFDVESFVRHNLPIVIVVSNNEGWTARVEGIRKPGRELGFTRFDKVAEALGGYGELVEDPNDIRPALERAFDAGVPAIVNVRTDPTARALSRFVGSKME